VASAVVLLGASVGGTALGMSATQRRKEREAAAAVAAFMRRHHALLTHDVVMAGGLVLDAWGHDLGLSATEKRRLRRTLEGSAEQGALVDALDGPIDERKARRFSAAFLRATERAVGKTRAKALVASSSRRTGGV
jgi:hypothetical protein